MLTLEQKERYATAIGIPPGMTLHVWDGKLWLSGPIGRIPCEWHPKEVDFIAPPGIPQSVIDEYIIQFIESHKEK